MAAEEEKKQSKTCLKCGRTKRLMDFYSKRNRQKFDLCKACLTMHIDNWDPDTYTWIIKEADNCYIPQLWEDIRGKAYQKSPTKMNGMTVMGKYFAQMKLKQYSKYSWDQSDAAIEEYLKGKQIKREEQEAQEEVIYNQWQRGEITEAKYKTLVSPDFARKKEDPDWDPEAEKQAEAAAQVKGPDYSGIPAINDPTAAMTNFYDESKYLSEKDLGISSLADELTNDDKIHLFTKWGRYYSPDEWIQLEDYYRQMKDSFTIEDADSEASLILICKNNLKMNQALDSGDLEGYQKLARVNDTLRKSAKFTAAQNKEGKSEFVDSVGQLVSYCQKYGHEIPSFNIKRTNKNGIDVVDAVLEDLKRYTYSLIKEDTALARQIEDYLTRKKSVEDMQRDQEEARAQGLEEVPLSDDDMADFSAELKRQSSLDEQLTSGGKKE